MRKLRGLLCAALALLLLAGCAPKEEPYPLSPENIRADTGYLCREIGVRVTGTAEERETAGWLEGRLEELGFAPERTAFSGLDGLESENVVAVCNPGGGKILCVTAHYDTVPNCPGARDNGAAVAILLKLARQLGPERQELGAEVRLLFLGSEENGYHGASAYVEGLSPEEREEHLAVFNMDISAASPEAGARLVCNTLGGLEDGVYREGNFLEPADNLVSQTIGQVFKELYGGESVPVLHCGESDHLIFHQAGIEAANVCWRAVDGQVPVLPGEYHRPDDTPEGLDYDTAVTTGRCVLAALYQLAGS